VKEIRIRYISKHTMFSLSCYDFKLRLYKKNASGKYFIEIYGDEKNDVKHLEIDYMLYNSLNFQKVYLNADDFDEILITPTDMAFYRDDLLLYNVNGGEEWN